MPIKKNQYQIFPYQKEDVASEISTVKKNKQFKEGVKLPPSKEEINYTKQFTASTLKSDLFKHKELFIKRHASENELTIKNNNSSIADKSEKIKRVVNTEKVVNSQKVVLKKEKKSLNTTPEFIPQIIDSSGNFKVNTTEIPQQRVLKTIQSTKKEDDIRIEFHFKETDWMLWYVVALLGILIWVRLFFQKAFSEMFQSAINLNLSTKQAKERNQASLQSSFLMNVIFIFNFGLFLFYTLKYFNLIKINNEFYITILCVVLLFVIYQGKKVFFRIIGSISDSKQITRLYIHSTYTLNKVYGILLFPFVFSIPYINYGVIDAKDLILIGWICFGLLYFLRISRGVLICIRQKISFFYLILYLCILEILPMMFLLKAAMMLGNI